MAYLDYENNILEDVSEIPVSEIFLLTGSELEEHIVFILKEYERTLTDNSGHDCLPPDYFSDEYKIMFDVMRINDTEVSRTNNPLKRKERQIENEIKNAFKGVVSEEVLNNGLFVNAQPDADYDEAHNYSQYIRNFMRVIEKHKKQVVNCRNAHPGFKMGFMIYDETDIYVQCASVEEATKQFDGNLAITDIHCAFLDSDFMKELEDSGLDFVIWVSPYKRYPGLPFQPPRMCIIDMEKYSLKEISKEYDTDCLRSF